MTNPLVRSRPDHWPDEDIASLVRDLADAHNRLKAAVDDRRALMDWLTCPGCSRDVAHVLGAVIAACTIIAELVEEQNNHLPHSMQIPIYKTATPTSLKDDSSH